MKKEELRKFIRETLIETFEEFSNHLHIIVLFDKSQKDFLDLLKEGKWVPSSEKDYWQRLDTPKFDHEQLHVHIARQKHINTKNKQVAWNIDGTHHDKKSFNNNFNGMETAKRIARNALGLPPDAILEYITNSGNGLLLLESVDYLPESSNVHIFQVRINGKTQLLKS